MAVQEFKYVKVSELPLATTIGDEDVVVINHAGKTSKIKFSDLLTVITQAITTETSQIKKDIDELNTKYGTLSSAVSDNTGTITNIITAGFNLIGID